MLRRSELVQKKFLDIDHHSRISNTPFCPASAKYINRYRKTDFAVGLIEGFCDKLAAQKPVVSDQEATTAVTPLKDPMLGVYMSHRYPRTRTFQRSASSQDDRVLKNGFDIGKHLVISKGIEVKKNSHKFLDK